MDFSITFSFATCKGPDENGMGIDYCVLITNLFLKMMSSDKIKQCGILDRRVKFTFRTYFDYLKNYFLKSPTLKT